MSTALVEVYCSAWNETDQARRKALLSESATPDVIYVDPTVNIRGLDALSVHIDVVFARYPGSRIERTSSVDIHHGLARFHWRKVLADGRVLPEGIDIVEFDAEGRLSRIIGFFGPVSRDG